MLLLRGHWGYKLLLPLWISRWHYIYRKYLCLWSSIPTLTCLYTVALWPVLLSCWKPLKSNHYWWSLSSIISLVAHPSFCPFLHPSLTRWPRRASAAAYPVIVDTLAFTALPVLSHCSNGGFRFQCKGQSVSCHSVSPLRPKRYVTSHCKDFSQ